MAGTDCQIGTDSTVEGGPARTTATTFERTPVTLHLSTPAYRRLLAYRTTVLA
jgi:hypothetical protein